MLATFATALPPPRSLVSALVLLLSLAGIYSVMSFTVAGRGYTGPAEPPY